MINGFIHMKRDGAFDNTSESADTFEGTYHLTHPSLFHVLVWYSCCPEPFAYAMHRYMTEHRIPDSILSLKLSQMAADFRRILHSALTSSAETSTQKPLCPQWGQVSRRVVGVWLAKNISRNDVRKIIWHFGQMYRTLR